VPQSNRRKRREINLENLTVIYPVEDGLNISSSTVTINKQIKVDMSLSSAPDRELFDLEVDNGSSNKGRTAC
jgi:hypothetical protein